MRHVALLTFAVVSFALSGCKSHCRALADKLCECTTSISERTNCQQLSATQEQQFPPTAADEAVCASLEDSCDCRLIDTPMGKERCGLAVSN